MYFTLNIINLFNFITCKAHLIIFLMEITLYKFLSYYFIIIMEREYTLKT